jgi:DNA-binding CsgD family transcriptional regulator
VTEPTVKAQLVHAFEKPGVENRTMAVRVALERRLIERE